MVVSAISIAMIVMKYLVMAVRCFLFPSLEGVLNVFLGQHGQFLVADAALGRQAVGLLLDGALEDVAHIAGVAEVLGLVGYNIVQVVLEQLDRIVGDGVLVLVQIKLEDVKQFLLGVVGEIDVDDGDLAGLPGRNRCAHPRAPGHRPRR